MEKNETNFSILVVDDNQINLMLMEDLLDAIDVNGVKTIDSGEGAIDEIKQNPNYDVIMMDICMPVMDGYETSKRIRELGYTGRIIALTAYGLSSSDPSFLESKMDDFLLKPIDLNLLKKVLCC